MLKMCFFQAKMDCLLIVAFFVLIKNSSHCTFRSVTSSFNASLMATFDKITEEECMSKCSMVLECTFMEYIEGTCKTFKHGTEVQELITASKVFAYSFDEDETSCPTATVSRPQTSTKKPAVVKKSVGDFCNCKYELAEWEAITLTSLNENPDDLRTVLFSPSPTELNSCKMIFVCSYGGGDQGWQYLKYDKEPTEEDRANFIKNVRPFACNDYSVESPYAVAKYGCFENKLCQKTFNVIDIEGERDPSFSSEYGELWRMQKDDKLFYVQKFEYV